MPNDLIAQFGLWSEPVLVLVVGTSIIVGLAALAERFVHRAPHQRAIWQTCALSLVALLVVELSGSGRGLVHSYASTLRATREGEHIPQPAPAMGAEGTPVLQAQGIALGTGGAGDALGPTGQPFEHTVGPLGREWDETAPLSPGRWPGLVEMQGLRPANRLEPAGTGATLNKEAEDTAETAVAHDGAPPRRPAWPAVLWLAGAVAISGRMLWRRIRLRVFLRRCRPAEDAQLANRVRDLAPRLGLRRPVRVLMAERLVTPVAFGALRPTIILPAELPQRFDARQQDAMLTHELAHLAAGDPAWQLLAGLICAVLWWQPLVWWSRRRLRAAGEAAADEASLLVPDGPGLLAECLVALGRNLARPRRLGWVSIEGQGFRSGLGRRVERLLELRAGSWRTPGRGLVLLKTTVPAVLVLAAISCTAWARIQAPLIEGGSTMSVWRSAWRGSLAAAAIWALSGPGYVAPAGEEKQGDAGKPTKVEVVVVATADKEAAKDPAPKDAEAREADKAKGDDAKRDRRREGEPRVGEGAAAVLQSLLEGQRAKAVQQRAMAERQRLEHISEDLQRRLKERPEGEDARALKEKLEQVTAQLREVTAQLRELGPPLNEERQKLQQSAAEIQQRLKERPEGEDARALKEKLGAIMARLKELGLPPGLERPPMRDREALERRLDELKREIGRLSDSGRRDEAERLENQAQRIRDILLGQTGARDRERPPLDDLARRIEHVRIAAENLREAGFPEQAENMMRLAERLKAAGPGERPERRRTTPPGERPLPPLPGPGGPMDLQELREQVQQTRREVQEIREQLKELLERSRR